jgi:hypothetical protein
MSGVPHDDSPSPPLKDRSSTTVALLILLVLFFGNGIWGSVTRTDVSNVNTVVRVPNYDFYIYYVAGSDWALGLSPYANHLDRPAARRFPTGGDGKMDGFLYPPTFLPVYGLLSHLPYNTARLLWLDLNLTAYVAAIIAAALFVRRRWAEFVTAAVILTIGAFAFTYSIQQGQIDLLASSLLVLAFVLYGRKRGWPTAALLAIAVLAKPTSAMVVVALVAYHRDLRLLGKTAAIGAVLVAASLALVDLGLYRDYVTSVLPAAAAPDPNWNNLSPLRYLSSVPSLARAVSLAGYVLLASLCYFAGRRSTMLPPAARRVPIQTERCAILLLAALCALIFSPDVWAMTIVWVLLPFALVITAAPPRGRPWAPVLVGAGAVLVSFVPDLGWLHSPRGFAAAGLAYSAVAVALLYLPLGFDELLAAETTTGED